MANMLTRRLRRCQMTLPEIILQHAQPLPEGGVLPPPECLHPGSRAAVDQVLPRSVIDALAARRGEAVVTQGAAAAHAPGRQWLP
jgi:hypothetical protein